MLSLRDLTNGEFQFVTDELPEHPANIREMPTNERAAYRYHLLRMVSGSTVHAASRIAALARIIELDAMLYSSPKHPATVRIQLPNGQEVTCHV